MKPYTSLIYYRSDEKEKKMTHINNQMGVQKKN